MNEDQEKALREHAEEGRKLTSIADSIPSVYVRFGRNCYPEGEWADATYSVAEPAVYETAFDTFGPFPIAKGVNLVIGKSGAGKTVFAKSLVKETGWTMLSYFEPVPTSRTSIADLAKTIQQFLVDPTQKGLIIDSFKALIYASGGSLARGGVNMSMLQVFSDLSAVASRHGKYIVGMINLTTSDEEVIENYLEAVYGSVNGLYHVQRPGAANVKIRDFISGDRINAQIKWSPEKRAARAGGWTADDTLDLSARPDGWLDALQLAARAAFKNDK